MPRPVVALPCGSRSTTRTRYPSSASAAPRLTAVVVLPTPPFWFAIARTDGSSIGGSAVMVSGGAAPWGSGGGGSLTSICDSFTGSCFLRLTRDKNGGEEAGPAPGIGRDGRRGADSHMFHVEQ